MTGVALVNVVNNESISESRICFISIDSTRSKGACSDGAVLEDVEEEGADDEVVEASCSGGAKKMVRIAGPSWSFVRLTVIEIAGLWYLRRGR